MTHSNLQWNQIGWQVQPERRPARSLQLRSSRGQCVNVPPLLLLLLNEDASPSAPWQSSPHLFCLPRCPTSVLTAAFNVLQSRGSYERLLFYLFFFFPPPFPLPSPTWRRKVLRSDRQRSDCDDCDLIKTWPRAKAVLVWLPMSPT